MQPPLPAHTVPEKPASGTHSPPFESPHDSDDYSFSDEDSDDGSIPDSPTTHQTHSAPADSVSNHNYHRDRCSRACLGCFRSKKKCDSKRPCGRCKRLKQTCAERPEKMTQEVKSHGWCTHCIKPLRKTDSNTHRCTTNNHASPNWKFGKYRNSLTVGTKHENCQHPAVGHICALDLDSKAYYKRHGFPESISIPPDKLIERFNQFYNLEQKAESYADDAAPSPASLLIFYNEHLNPEHQSHARPIDSDSHASSSSISPPLQPKSHPTSRSTTLPNYTPSWDKTRTLTAIPTASKEDQHIPTFESSRGTATSSAPHNDDTQPYAHFRPHQTETPNPNYRPLPPSVNVMRSLPLPPQPTKHQSALRQQQPTQTDTDPSSPSTPSRRRQRSDRGKSNLRGPIQQRVSKKQRVAGSSQHPDLRQIRPPSPAASSSARPWKRSRSQHIEQGSQQNAQRLRSNSRSDPTDRDFNSISGTSSHDPMEISPDEHQKVLLGLHQISVDTGFSEKFIIHRMLKRGTDQYFELHSNRPSQ